MPADGVATHLSPPQSIGTFPVGLQVWPGDGLSLALEQPVGAVTHTNAAVSGLIWLEVKRHLGVGTAAADVENRAVSVAIANQMPRADMRALFCLKGPNEINGPNVWLTRHLPLLRQHGIEPRVLYVAQDLETPCRFLSALDAGGVRVRKVGLGRFTEDHVPAILRGIEAEQPDVFVPNYTAAAYFACRYAREAGIRTIGVLHSDDPYYHDIIDVCLTGHPAWNLDGIVAVSDYLHSLATSAAPPATRVLHATYGVPVPATRAAAPDKSLTLLYSGRLVERQKRVHRVVDRLCAAGQAIDGVRGILYGDGPERPALEERLAQAGGRVVLGGVLTPDAVMPAMQRGHAFVLLSDFEGLSIAMVEAMASGLVPIVSHMRSGTGDLVEHDVNGLIVDADDEGAFVRAVRRLRDERGLWRRLSTAARQAVVSRGYTSDECARRWADLCTDLGRPDLRRPIAVPPRANVPLPPRSVRPFGLRLDDRRDPWQEIVSAAEAGRPIFLWGAGRGGEEFLVTATGRLAGIVGVIDRRADGGEWMLDGVPVHPPSHLARQRTATRSPFVIITSIFDSEIARELEQLGYRAEQDFIAA